MVNSYSCVISGGSSGLSIKVEVVQLEAIIGPLHVISWTVR